MLSFDDLLIQRKSIRKYRSELPHEELVESVVSSALHYPSPSGSHPVYYYLISSNDVLNSIHEDMKKGYESMLAKWASMEKPKRIRNYINAYWRYSEFMFESPVLLAAGIKTPTNSFSKNLVDSGLLDSNIREKLDLNTSLGASLMAFQLKSSSLGLGSCILTAPLYFISNMDFIPDSSLELSCFLTLGYPEDQEERKNLKHDIESYFKVI